MKNIFTSKKWLTASLVCIFILLCSVGVATSMAQPTLEDVIGNRVYGTYIPSQFYDDTTADVSNWEVVGSLNTTDIIVDYSAWYDANEDGLIDVDDVYSQENFQFKFLVDTQTLPILSTGASDYYMVKLSQFTQVDSVIASIHLANDNDNAELKQLSQYCYDRDTDILYLAPSLMNDIDDGLELKAQTVSIVHNIDDFTKEFALVSGLADDIGSHPIESTLPNGIQKRSYKRWLMDGLDIPLISPEYLAYVSSADITVYVNERENTSWVYDPTTGVLSFPDSTPKDVNNIVIAINDIEDASLGNALLQYAQNQWGNTAQAVTFDSLPENRLCQHLTYIEEPQLGRTEALDFYAFAHHEVPKNTTSTTFNLNNMKVSGLTVFDHATGAVSREDILRALKNAYGNQTVTWNPSKGTTSLANDVLSVWQPFDAGATNVSNLFVKLNSMHINYSTSSGVATSYLDAVRTELDTLSVYNGTSGQLLDSWQYWKEGSSAHTSQTTIGMYVVGKTNSTNKLLNGYVDQGFPYFTLTSCNIHLPNVQYNTVSGVAKDDSHKTVISIVGRSDKYLYVCIAPLALAEDGSFGYERLCGFTKIRYTYTGRGNVTFIKTDVHKAWVGDADYEIYKGINDGGEIKNSSLVNYYNYFNDTDYVNKENATAQGNTITTSSTAAVKISLPYISGNEVYYFLEKVPPTGYLRDTVKRQFILNPQSSEVTVWAEDIKQNGVITWSVYDATTRSTPENPRVEIGLGGIPFTLIDESGRPAVQYNSQDEVIMTYDRVVTDANGKIVFNVRPGTYYVRQLDAIENYFMDIRDKEDLTAQDENCNYFKIVVTPDRTGQDIPLAFSHYEKRQEVRIQTQVYDEIIGNKTPPQLGGTGAGEVETINSEWELHVLSGNLLVGYQTNGMPVYINKNSGALNVSSVYHSNPTIAYAGGGANNPGTSPQLTYISATHITIDNVTYPLPNGTYFWKLKQASKGYVTTANRTTDLDAKWIDPNKYDQLKIVMDVRDPSILSYVIMDRQQADITIYSKAYEKTHHKVSYNYVDIVPSYDAFVWDDTRDVFQRDNYNIVVNSSHAQIQPASAEQFVYTGKTNATVYAKQFATYSSPQTNGTADLIINGKPHAVYQLQNTTDIVTMEGGVIPANTILGRYLSDDMGYIFINKFGSDLIINPNVTSRDINATFPAVGVIDTTGRGANDTQLPNGDYMLSVIMAPDEHEIEDMFENTPIYHPWSKTGSVQDIISTINTIPFFHARNTLRADGQPNAGTYIAPSPIDTTPEDPYTPRTPDDPTNDPDDSTDIPYPENLDWIIKHRNDRTYRTIERDNFADTQDIVPTTFTTTYTDSTITEWDSEYAMYMFYEITADEYNTARQNYLAAGHSEADWVRNWDYRTQAFNGERLYFRRFGLNSTGTAGGAHILSQILAFNKTSPGWTSYEEILRNSIVSGAIENTSWNNTKLADPAFNGNYHIAFGVLTVRETYNPLSNMMLRKEEFSDSIAILSIRNRQLFNLE